MKTVEAFHRVGQKTFGPWGLHTSTMDFCEDNYALFPYVAEAYNTFSNIPYMMLGLHGALNTPRGHPSHVLAHLGVAVIGMGSFVFHATLRWDAQLFLDEFPMVYVSALVLYIVVAAGPSAKLRAPAQSLALKLGMALILVLANVLYLKFPYPAVHQRLFGVIIVSVYFRIRHLQKYLTPECNRICSRLMTPGAIIFVLGYAIWRADGIWCDHITQWRGTVGEELGWVSQGHAWWHVLTGIGACRIITGVTYLTLSLEDPARYDVAYRLGVFPYLVNRPLQPKKLT